MSLFSGSRQVVYGFVPHCKQATLRAKIGSKHVDTMVSTSELGMTKGRVRIGSVYIVCVCGLIPSPHWVWEWVLRFLGWLVQKSFHACFLPSFVCVVDSYDASVRQS